MVTRSNMRSLAVTALLVGSADAYSFGLAPGGAGMRAPQLRHAGTMRPGVAVAPLRMQVGTEEKKKGGFFQEQGINNIATSAVVAVAAVNAAVSMRKLEAPEVLKTYIVMDDGRTGVVDEEGLPLVYNKEAIEKYWKAQDGALQGRWREFLGITVPFLTKLVAMLVRGGPDEVTRNTAELAKEARMNLEKLGPTYIKAGQMMSVRPDVLPQEALDELAILQDSVEPFDTVVAIAAIERELGRELGEVFSDISFEPVAAASLAQVYKATLLTGEVVAVKIQRPDVLSTVSKDLYVLRRAAEVYQGLIERFAPQQRTNYVALLNEWAVGCVPPIAGNTTILEHQTTVYEELSTRRLLVTEWVDGVKLSDVPKEELGELIAVGQESFLTQLLQVGFFHSDPHPGNMIRMHDQSKGKLALIDFGLVASLEQYIYIYIYILEDMDQIVSAIIHLANKDYTSLVDDFVKLQILPGDCDRSKVVIPLMDKALSPYVKGGGAKNHVLSQDALTVLNDIPFSIPAYFALIARAVITLEGVALQGDPDYGIVMEAYPFVARKLLSEDRPVTQKALQEVLYRDGGLQTQRLSVLLNGALGVVARTKGGAFVDLDSIPEEGVGLREALGFLLSPKTRSLRQVLTEELDTASDVLLRQALRKSFGTITSSIPPLPFLSNFLPRPETIPAPLLLPTSAGTPAPVFLSPQEVLDAIAPKLTRDEELYAISLADLASSALGKDAATIVAGDALLDPRAAPRLLLTLLRTGRLPDNVPQVPTPPITSPRLRPPPLRPPTSIHARRGAPPGQGEQLEELSSAVSDLSGDERAIFEAAGDELLARAWDRALTRLAPLAGAAPPIPRGEKGDWLMDEEEFGDAPAHVPAPAPAPVRETVGARTRDAGGEGGERVEGFIPPPPPGIPPLANMPR
ncbi:hypothetical protein T484DRAFT_3645222 [Baffinella frigidus]|nr:hypothetical protein T484DRAFT_3645222 [Cryptophyta sp. CCMP2293]